MKILLGLIVLLAPSPAASLSWPQFRRDESRAAYVAEGVNPPLTARWTFSGSTSPILSSPVVAYDKVYYGSRDHKVYALDAYAGGPPVWTYTTGGRIDASLAIASGTVYASSRDGKLYALDALTGSLRWSFDPGSGPANASSPAVYGGNVYFVTGYPVRKLFILDSKTGPPVKYSADLSNFSASSPVIDKVNGRVLLGTSDGKYNAYNLNLAQVWPAPFETKGGIYFATPAVSSGSLLAAPGDVDRTLHSLAGADGTQDWVSPDLAGTATETSLTSGVAVSSDTAFLGAGVSPHCLFAIDLSTGGRKWVRALGAPSKFGIASSPAVANNMLYILTPQGRLQAVHTSNGDLREEQVLAGEGLSSPAIANGWVYAATMGGTLYAFESQRTWSISSPDSVLDTSGVVEGTVTVRGSVRSPSLQSYTLEYGQGAAPASWTALVTGVSEVTRSTLAVWNTDALPVTDTDNRYTLRLRVAETASSDLETTAVYTFAVTQQKASAVSAANGGALALADGTEVVFPPGALNGNDTLTVKKLFSPYTNENVGIPDGAVPTTIAREFTLSSGPNPTFLKPVTLKFPYTAANVGRETDLRVYFFNTAANQWQIVNTSTVHPEETPPRVHAEVSHFTLFRVMQFSPLSVTLDENEVYTYPNPARGNTVTFKYRLGDTADVTIRIFDVSGSLVGELTKAGEPGGIASTMTWDVTGKASGLYIYQLDAKTISGATAQVIKKLAIIH